MIRSALFVPGNNPSMMQNADVFGADAVIFDLEDSVHVNEKDNARNLVLDYLHKHPALPTKIIIRVNAIDTPFYRDDIEKMVSDQIDMIMLPKAKVESIKSLGVDLFALENAKGMRKTIGIIPIIELASSLLETNQIAASFRVKGILLGAEDYCSDMEIARSLDGQELIYPRSLISVACKANKIDAIDTPFTDVMEDSLLEKDCLIASNLGMNAKAAIHPRQINTIHNVFSPSFEQIIWAKKVISAANQAKQKGLGVFSLDGKMIDKPIYERALHTYDKAIQFGIIGDKHEK